MQTISLTLMSLVLAFVALSGCSKNNTAPPAPPRVAVVVPVGVARIATAPLRGVWATDCRAEVHRRGTVTYRSTRTYLIVDATRMTRRVVRFGPLECARTGTVAPIAPTPAEVWTYRITQVGTVDGAGARGAWNLEYDDGEFEFDGTARITRTAEPRQVETVRFDANATPYRRILP